MGALKLLIQINIYVSGNVLCTTQYETYSVTIEKKKKRQMIEAKIVKKELEEFLYAKT